MRSSSEVVAASAAVAQPEVNRLAYGSGRVRRRRRCADRAAADHPVGPDRRASSRAVYAPVLAETLYIPPPLGAATDDGCRNRRRPGKQGQGTSRRSQAQAPSVPIVHDAGAAVRSAGRGRIRCQEVPPARSRRGRPSSSRWPTMSPPRAVCQFTLCRRRRSPLPVADYAAAPRRIGHRTHPETRADMASTRTAER